MAERAHQETRRNAQDSMGRDRETENAIKLLAREVGDCLPRKQCASEKAAGHSKADRKIHLTLPINRRRAGKRKEHHGSIKPPLAKQNGRG
jgi:hypothetical protein